jgi:hypothetical protein
LADAGPCNGTTSPLDDATRFLERFQHLRETIRLGRVPMIVFIGTLFWFLHIVRLFAIIIARSPHRDDPGE